MARSSKKKIAAYVAAHDEVDRLNAIPIEQAADLPFDLQAKTKEARRAESLVYRTLTGGELGAVRRILATRREA